MDIISPMEVLSMNKHECHNTYLVHYSNAYDNIVIGAAILKHKAGSHPEILLLKRAGHETHYPNRWEIPSGKFEETDPTLLDAIRREVLEETSLKVESIIGSISSFAYYLAKHVVEWDGNVTTEWPMTLQLGYICQVRDGELVVDPEEHSEGRFVDQSGLEDLEMTAQMRKVVGEAFAWYAQVSTGLKDTGEEVASGAMGASEGYLAGGVKERGRSSKHTLSTLSRLSRLKSMAKLSATSG